MLQQHVATDGSGDRGILPLPAPLTSFVGRQREMAEIKRLLETSRLVTLTGAGGCGKTRLALRVASDLCAAYPDGACWVELAPLADAALLPQAVAQALNTIEHPGHALLDVILDLLHDKRLLLVLDNCEHLASACGEFAHDVLCDAAHVGILATSREPLAVAGEMLYPVAPLAVPPGPKATDIAEFDSIRLFVERARSVRPNFTLTPDNAAHVADICRRLDGIPLAIELASGRVNVLTVEQIASRLDDRFSLLTSATHGMPSHHRTLRAALDWSYDSLPPEEQILLSRLSAFAGGCTLKAVEQVCAGEGIAVEQIVDGLSSLVNKSLLIAQTLEPGEARYRMLETIREYAREKLHESGQGDTVRDRHLDFFLEFAREAEKRIHGPNELEWLDRLDLEHDNLRAALEWSLGQARADKGAELVRALLWFWDIRAHWREGRERAEELLALPAAAGKNLLRVAGLLVAGVMSSRWNLGDDRATRRYLEELVTIARELGEPGKRFLAVGLHYLSEPTFGDKPALAESMLEESLAMARSLDEQWLVATSLRFKADLARSRSHYADGHNFCEESLKICRLIGDERGIAESLAKAGQVFGCERDYASARHRLEENLLYFRRLRNLRDIAGALVLLGEVERSDGQYDKAGGCYLEAIEISRRLGSRLVMSVALSNLGFVYLHRGQLDSAKSVFVESCRLRKHAEGLAPLNLLAFATVLSIEKNARRAVPLLAAYQTFADCSPGMLGPADEADYERCLALAREQLDKATFDAAWEEGKKLTLEQAIALAEQETMGPSPAPALALRRDPNALTPREVEVLRLVAAGLSDSQVAAKLVISRRTVSTHLTAIYGKLGVKSRTAATRFALDHNLI